MIDKNKIEMICYLSIFMALVIIVTLNNVFWKIGKEDNKKGNNIVYLKSNNITYNVPFEGKVLD